MRPLLPALAAVLLIGCGYPGDPMPPALNRPMRVGDLSAVERGSKILVSFALPEKTTENLPIKADPEIELRVGPIGDRFVEAEWVQGSDRVPTGMIQVEKGRVAVEIPAGKYVGRTVVIGVKLRSPKGLDVGWSNLEVLNILPALPMAEGLAAKDISGGVGLEWRVAGSAPEFRVYRRLKSEKDWAVVGTSDKTSFADTTVDFGSEYEYMVQAGAKTDAKYVEGELSAAIAFKPVDRFAPAAPAGLAAVPGTKTIELVWDRSPELDWAFYRVYRDNILLADKVQAAAFGDKDVVAGAKHSYQVTAVDTAGNESARSGAVNAVLP